MTSPFDREYYTIKVTVGQPDGREHEYHFGQVTGITYGPPTGYPQTHKLLITTEDLAPVSLELDKVPPARLRLTNEPLSVAIEHLKHMAAHIGKTNRILKTDTYSFESLSEDIDNLTARLAETPERVRAARGIADRIRWLVDEEGDTLKVAVELSARAREILSVIDRLVNLHGETRP